MKNRICLKLKYTPFEDVVPWTISIGLLLFMVFVFFSTCSLPYTGGIFILFGPTFIAALLQKSGCMLCDLFRKSIK